LLAWRDEGERGGEALSELDFVLDALGGEVVFWGDEDGVVQEIEGAEALIARHDHEAGGVWDGA